MQEKNFSELDLTESSIRAIKKLGFEKPTYIQEKVIPLALKKHDIIASSQTGTGKTAAFGISLLNILEKDFIKNRKVKCLILEPVRELAVQVHQNLCDLAQFTNLRFALFYGGTNIRQHIRTLKNPVDVVISTPGRLLDLSQSGHIDLSHLQILVLDEVDRLLDMGFIKDVKKIISKTPNSRQTMIFSATVTPDINKLTKDVLKKPVQVNVETKLTAADTIDHYFYPIARDQRNELLKALLKETEYNSVIIFTRTKREADKLSFYLERDCKLKVATLHSDIPQRKRLRVLESFKDGTFKIIVATDVASRGLDISAISHVINYRLPESPEDYVHRIGRTGRAKRSGTAMTLLSADEIDVAKKIERIIKQKIEHKKIADFNYVFTTLIHGNTTKSMAENTPKRRPRRRRAPNRRRR